nr:exocyst complex component SEC3A-like [Ipomoea batatas]
MQIEARNNKLEMQSVNNRKLIEDLDRLVEKFCIPAEHASYLTGDSFDEACMHRNVEACEWLTGAIVRLDSPNLDSTYSNMRALSMIDVLCAKYKGKREACRTSNIENEFC